MKLTKSINVQGTTVPAGTELHFSNEGIGYYNGVEVQRDMIPEVATEAKQTRTSRKFSVEGMHFDKFSPSYVYNGQTIKAYLEKHRIKVDFDPQPWHNASYFLGPDMVGKVIFYVWDTGKIEHEIKAPAEPVFYDMTWDGRGNDRGYSPGRIPQPTLPSNSEIGKYAIKLESDLVEHNAKLLADRHTKLDDQLKNIDQSEIDKVVADFKQYIADDWQKAVAADDKSRYDSDHRAYIFDKATWSIINKFMKKHDITDRELLLKKLKLYRPLVD